MIEQEDDHEDHRAGDQLNEGGRGREMQKREATEPNGQGEQEDRQDRRLLAHAQRHEAVAEMVGVGQEGAVSSPQADDDDGDHVEQG